MALEGRQLGRFQIVRLLGSGGMGEVYLAEDPRIHQQVAIKVIRTEQSPYPNTPDTQTAARLFEREARAIVALDHPRILPLNDYGEETEGKTNLIYLVMPYRPEGSLVDWVRQFYPDTVTPPHAVAHIVGQAAEALQHAHNHQIIHMDVKPSNFLIRTNEKTPTLPDLLLGDFGVAHVAGSTATTSQVIRGTPTYMAPEQCEGEAVPASDQYALAVMAYELLTGRPPFLGNPMRIMFQHVNTPPEPPSTHNPQLSGEVDDVLLTALSKNPAERFRSVTAFATAFNNAVQAMGVGESPTLISGSPLPRITRVLPAVSPISAELLNAPTQLIQPGSAPSWPGPGGADTSTPTPQGWAAANTIPTALPLPDTLSQVAQGSGPVAPPVPTPTGPTPSAGDGRKRRRRWAIIAAAVLVILALVGAGLAYAFLGRPAATVTITPASKHENNTFTISAVLGAPDASQQQVDARLISVTTPSYSKTVNVAQQNQPGTAASGYLTIVNDTYSPITLTAGTSFPNQGSGPFLYIALNATVTIDYFSAATIFAHVTTVGTIGNIGSNRFSYCYSGDCVNVPYVLIYNSSNFSGGQDPQTVTTVQQSDIDDAANSLISANQPDPQQALRGQVRPNERLVGTPQCTPNITSDHQAGDMAAQITVTVSFTCTGEVYDYSAAVALATNLLGQQATTDTGGGYVLAGKVNLTFGNPSVDAQNNVTLPVTADGVWVYRFSDAQKQALAQLIAGMSVQTARQLLTSQAGVAQASIDLSGGGQTLPSDPARIMIVIETIAGA